MSMTTLDPQTALIVIDLQTAIADRDDVAPHSPAEVIARSVALIERFRVHGLPVVLVNVDGTPPGRTDLHSGGSRILPPEATEFVEEVRPTDDDIVVTKRARSAFAGTGLEKTLRDRGVTQVVVVGIATGAGVESTARDAHEAGFHVTLPVDAMTDTDERRHIHSLAVTFPTIAETGSTTELLELLDTTRQ
ncbi:isochorismatase family cysteine hydrolase [Gordonia sp. CPCC 206044]|uniref:cysteine hydrolase family protein n=1 Tax=Gordonia sp. CPCC 206044 TaxID=3140793 RepID=UPI003AF3DC15